MGALSKLIAKELSSALGIADNPKYNPAFKDKSKTKMRDLQTLEDEQDFGDDLGQYIPDDDDMPTAEEFYDVYGDDNPNALYDMQDIFETDDPDYVDLVYGDLDERKPTYKNKTNLTTFYSPLMSAIDEAPISEKGTLGKNINAFVRKRAPKMSKGELDYTGDFLEPNKKYTREQAQDAAYDKGFTIEANVGSVQYERMQRQSINTLYNPEYGYFEITLDLERNTNKSKKMDLSTHHGSNTIGHARIGHYAAQDDQYYLIEELQSDMLQKNSNVKDLPLKKNKDYVRNLLQATFILAKKNGINKIVMPPVKRLRDPRVDDLRASSKDEGVKVFNETYNIAFKKALKSLQNEYPSGTIKTGERELPYATKEYLKLAGMGYSPSARKPLSTEVGFEIDITELDLDNLVPRFNEGGLVKKPGLMQRLS